MHAIQILKQLSCAIDQYRHIRIGLKLLQNQHYWCVRSERSKHQTQISTQLQERKQCHQMLDERKSVPDRSRSCSERVLSRRYYGNTYFLPVSRGSHVVPFKKNFKKILGFSGLAGEWTRDLSMHNWEMLTCYDPTHTFWHTQGKVTLRAWKCSVPQRVLLAFWSSLDPLAQKCNWSNHVCADECRLEWRKS